MSVRVCDRCGDITLNGEGCTCATPYSLSEVRRRHRAAVESARITTSRGFDQARVESGRYRAAAASTPASPTGPNSVEDWAAPRRTAAVAVSGGHAAARVPGPDSISRPGSGTPGARVDAAAPARHEPRPAPDPDWLPTA